MDVFKFAFFLASLWHVTYALHDLVCNAGQYRPADGSTCLPCPPKTYMTLNRHTEKTCFPCTEIVYPAVERLISPCDGLHDSNIQCVSGHFRRLARNPREISSCRKCLTTCPENHIKVHPCQNFSNLGCCPGENYDYSISENGITFCRKRPWMCRRGHFWDTEVNDCKPCPAGTFMHEDYHSNTKCWDCQSESETYCPLHTVITQTCTSTQPSRYGCRENYYVNHGMSYRGDDIGCSPCQTCEKGKYVGRQCDMHHDTVCCDKPNMTVEDGPQGGNCVDNDRKDVGGEADDSTSIPWLILVLVIILLMIVGIICVIFKKRLQKLVQDTFLRRKRTARGDDGTLEEVLIDKKLPIQKLAQEINKKINKLEDIGSENAMLLSKIQELETDKKNLTGKVETVAREKAMLQSKIQELETSNTNLTGEKDTLQTEIRKLEADNIRLTNKMNKRNREMESVQSENEKLIMEIKNLKEKPDGRAYYSEEQDQKAPQVTEHCYNQNRNISGLGQIFLRPYLRGLRSKNHADQATAADKLHKLASAESNRQMIEQYPGLVTALETLKDSENELVREKVRLALLAIKGTTSATDEDGRLPAPFDIVSDSDDDITVQGTTPATEEEKSIPAMVDSADISVQGATPTTSEEKRLLPDLDMVLNFSADISVHEATPVTDDTRLPASSVNEQQTDHTDQGRGDVAEKLE